MSSQEEKEKLEEALKSITKSLSNENKETIVKASENTPEELIRFMLSILKKEGPAGKVLGAKAPEGPDGQGGRRSRKHKGKGNHGATRKRRHGKKY
jgi:hypothetical protein